MKFLKEYWAIILMAVSLISSTTAAQIQVAQNKIDISENDKAAMNSDAKIILLVQKEVETASAKAEKAHAETEKEIEKLKAKQEKQTALQINQQYLIKGMDSMQDAIKDLAKEIRNNRSKP